jgi:hypothetical protein
MTPSDFLPSLESVLQHRRVSFSRAAAIAFVESCCELIADEPDVWYWSERFVEAGGVEIHRDEGQSDLYIQPTDCRIRTGRLAGYEATQEGS